ncbi:MAG: aminoacetone oxidase family FAD-binding enzyme [Lachnospiraceae bacterium]|nr:aminoacetone oxidase family FAD-binding enzyme [Lachnospiraceae bacterium]
MRIAVIGTGASGIMAAITAARNGASVTCFDTNDKIGKKLYATGNGKCNFSNKALCNELLDKVYPGVDSSFLGEAFARFSVDQICDFFETEGLIIQQRDGYLYPYSGQSSTIVQLFENIFRHEDITFLGDVKVTGIKLRPDHRFCLTFLAGNNAPKKLLRDHTLFDRVILACGGKAAPVFGSDGNGYILAQSLGHHVTGIRPSLCGIKCDGSFWKSISGVRTKALMSVFDSNRQLLVSECGELQLCDYGISGIPTFQISHIVGELLWKQQTFRLAIDFLPDYESQSIFHVIHTRMIRYPDISLEQLFEPLLNHKLIHEIVAFTPCHTVCENTIHDVIHRIKHFEVTPLSLNDFTMAQVTAGGIVLDEILPTMESRVLPGLFFCGEILDVDGICGGYNLQWAWTSGYLAGLHSSETEVLSK